MKMRFSCLNKSPWKVSPTLMSWWLKKSAPVLSAFKPLSQLDPSFAIWPAKDRVSS